MAFIENFIIQTLFGVQFGFVLFLIASGISISLGILGVLNLAHGELYALGAFVSASVTATALGLFEPGAAGILGVVGVVLVSVLVSGLIVSILGLVMELGFLRPIYDRHEVYQVILTFGLLLIVRDLMKFWPTGVRLDRVYSEINSIPAAELVGLNFPTYSLYVILLGAILFVAMLWFFDRTKTGRIIRATAIDREMATAIGVNTPRVFTIVFVASVFLAAMAGAFVVPRAGAQIGMGNTPLVLSFVVVVIGGIGSIKGTLVGALLVGVISRWATWQYPPVELAAPFLIMAIILLVKPTGLFKAWGETA